MLKHIILDESNEAVTPEQYLEYLLGVGKELTQKSQNIEIVEKSFLEMIKVIDHEVLTENDLLELLTIYVDFYMFKNLAIEQ